VLLAEAIHALGAHSVMIATAAESNPTVFSPVPFVDLERTFIPSYLRLVRLTLIPLSRHFYEFSFHTHSVTLSPKSFLSYQILCQSVQIYSRGAHEGGS
jgi:hypothetical protein